MAALSRPNSKAVAQRLHKSKALRKRGHTRATGQVHGSVLRPQREAAGKRGKDDGRVFREEIAEPERGAIDVACIGEGKGLRRLWLRQRTEAQTSETHRLPWRQRGAGMRPSVRGCERGA